jgi:molybdopterin biosynthesis enzyme
MQVVLVWSFAIVANLQNLNVENVKLKVTAASIVSKATGSPIPECAELLVPKEKKRNTKEKYKLRWRSCRKLDTHHSLTSVGVVR